MREQTRRYLLQKSRINATLKMSKSLRTDLYHLHFIFRYMRAILLMLLYMIIRSTCARVRKCRVYVL